MMVGKMDTEREGRRERARKGGEQKREGRVRKS